MPRRIRGYAPVEEPRRVMVHLLEEPVRVEPLYAPALSFPARAPLRVQRPHAVAQDPVQAVHKVRHLAVPRRPVVRRGGVVDDGGRRAPVQARELERDERVHDEVARAHGMQRAERVQLAVRDVGEGDVDALVVGDEVVDPDVVCADEEDDDEGGGVEEEPLGARAVVRDVVLDEPGLLTRGDVWDAEEGRELVGADGPAHGVVPDRIVAVEAEIEWPLEASVRSCIRLWGALTHYMAEYPAEKELTGG